MQQVFDSMSELALLQKGPDSTGVPLAVGRNLLMLRRLRRSLFEVDSCNISRKFRVQECHDYTELAPNTLGASSSFIAF